MNPPPNVAEPFTASRAATAVTTASIATATVGSYGPGRVSLEGDGWKWPHVLRILRRLPGESPVVPHKEKHDRKNEDHEDSEKEVHLTKPLWKLEAQWPLLAVFCRIGCCQPGPTRELALAADNLGIGSMELFARSACRRPKKIQR